MTALPGPWCAPLRNLLDRMPHMRDAWFGPLCDGLLRGNCACRDRETCGHPRTLPPFDEAAARGLSAEEVRRRWPRFWGACPDCGAQVIAYASVGHFIAGDW